MEGGHLTIHATARIEYAQARLLGWVTSLSLTGSPTISSADEPSRAAEAAPWVRVTFDELPMTWQGKFNTTQTAYQMGLLFVADVIWPQIDATTPGAADLYAPTRAASELREALTLLRLDYYEYSTPASPTTVADAVLTCARAEVRRIADPDGYRRLQVRGTVDWIGRFDDDFS
jgi:hypothetical protein